MNARIVAFYLPQFYPFEENNLWWGKGFTEWTNVTKAKPLFDGHYQPHLPADLGFYDLRLREVQHEQIALARTHGIDGFCFHYYWFDGKRLLDRPVDDFLADAEADFPFCLCWANENWTRRWDAAEHELLIGQNYGDNWHQRYADDIAPFLRDKRYIRVGGRPLLVIYRPQHIPDTRRQVDQLREAFRRAGIGEVHLVCALTHGNDDYAQYGFDAGVEFPPHNMLHTGQVQNYRDDIPSYRLLEGAVVDFAEVAKFFTSRDYTDKRVYRTVYPSWDNTARVDARALVTLEGTPDNYERWLREALRLTTTQRHGDDRILFVNAWNEWAEGCHLEPDRQYGHGFLEATRRAKQGESIIPRHYDRSPLILRKAAAPPPPVPAEQADIDDEPDARTQGDAPDSVAAAVETLPPLRLGNRLSMAKLRYDVADWLRGHPRTFQFVRSGYHRARGVRHALATTFGGGTKHKPAAEQDVEVKVARIWEAAIEVGERDHFLARRGDTMWTGCCAEVIKGRHPPKLVVAEGCRNAGALRELLQEQRYESHSVKYGRFFECIVDPVGVCLLTREQQLIWETIRVYEYFDAGFSKLQHVGSRDGKYYARAGEFDRIDADVIIPFHASMAFGHFIFDGLPQILHFIDEIRDGRLKILLPDTRPGWCDKHLAHWGIDASHCIVAPAQRSFVVKSAIVCSALTTLSAFYPNRQFMAGFTADAGNVSSAGDPTRRKVYLKRKSAANFSDREITNEEAVAAALEARGVHVADPSRMSMSDQVRMFREADLIVGAHGSAFANLAFCRPETKVIDLMPDDWIGYWNKRGITERWLARVSAMNNLDYCVLLCASNTSQSDLGGGASILYEVDIDRLLETIGLNTPAS